MVITHADDNADDLTANIDNVEDCNNDSDDSDSSQKYFTLELENEKKVVISDISELINERIPQLI